MGMDHASPFTMAAYCASGIMGEQMAERSSGAMAPVTAYCRPASCTSFSRGAVTTAAMLAGSSMAMAAPVLAADAAAPAVEQQAVASSVSTGIVRIANVQGIGQIARGRVTVLGRLTAGVQHILEGGITRLPGLLGLGGFAEE